MILNWNKDFIYDVGQTCSLNICTEHYITWFILFNYKKKKELKGVTNKLYHKRKHIMDCNSV
jgi:hypothetical protein